MMMNGCMSLYWSIIYNFWNYIISLWYIFDLYNGQCKFKKKLHALGWTTYNGISVLVPVDGNLNSTRYIKLLDNHLIWLVFLKVLGNHQFTVQDYNKTPPPLSRQTDNLNLENGIEKINCPVKSLLIYHRKCLTLY